MDQHLCGKEAEISEIMTLLKGIVKEFYGNGNPGIARSIPLLEQSITNLTATVAAQTKVVSDLVAFQTSFNAVDNYKDKQGISNRAKVAIIITAIIGFCSISCTIIINLA
jgi:hypothetical protein